MARRLVRVRPRGEDRLDSHLRRHVVRLEYEAYESRATVGEDLLLPHRGLGLHPVEERLAAPLPT